MELGWMNLTEIGLLLAACYTCYRKGIEKGVEEVVLTLLDEKVITQNDLDRLGEKK